MPWTNASYAWSGLEGVERERAARKPMRRTFCAWARGNAPRQMSAVMARRRSNLPSPAIGSPNYTPRLFHLDVGGLDDRPPLLGLGLVEGGEALGRLQLARGDVEAKI